MPLPPVTNRLVTPLLTDLYEYTMACSYFQSGRHEDRAVFDLFFRRNPFGGEYAVFAGLSEVVSFLSDFSLSDPELDYIESVMPQCSDAFKKWLRHLDCRDLKVYAQREGSAVFPRVPLLRVEGPLGLCQLIESVLLNLISYPTLIATNAARMKLAAGGDAKVVEFGLRRAQGPDGAMSASRYAYLGGIDGTSNLAAGRLFGIDVSGTQAHSYISSFVSLDDLATTTLRDPGGNERDFVGPVLEIRKHLGFDRTNDSELAAFIAYARAFPDGFLALVDTYDTLHSGIPNFLVVALALLQFGYQPVGIRLDSGDLSHLSIAARRMFDDIAAQEKVDLKRLVIVASNEINEATLNSLQQQGNEIDIFGVGTHLVTCQKEPSLGCVYKLVEINGSPRIKISQDVEKVTIPGRKDGYRLYGSEGYPIADLMVSAGDTPPQPGQRILCCHPYDEKRRSYISPRRIEDLHRCVWDGGPTIDPPDLESSRALARRQIRALRADHTRMLNPTPYKVSLSEQLFTFMHDLWRREAPVGEIG